MKRVSMFLVFTICLSLIGCSYSLDMDKDGDADAKTNLIQNYTVTFASNGGSSVSSQTTSEILSAPRTTRSGYEFKGWYRDSNLSVPVVYPFKLNSNVTLYAKWLKLTGTTYYENSSVKSLDDARSSRVTYQATPIGFDLDTLAREGYKIKIEITFDCYYKQDYDVPFDIGYMGPPYYKVRIYNSDDLGRSVKKLAPETKDSITVVYDSYASMYNGTQIYLEFSTENIQNITFFKNIKLTYTFYK